MFADEIRNRYLKFFESKGHTIIPSASLVPENDPTTLFTSSGMQPLVSYFLGEKHPKGLRLVNSQKSFRTEDIEEVGDNRHTTFFEMLGNWSLGDYFKDEQIPWFFEFLTKDLGLPADKLYVTVFSGDEKLNLPKDKTSAEIWKNLFRENDMEAKEGVLETEARGGERGMQEGRIFYYRDKNWWSRSGSPEQMPAGEPGGPDSEVFYDFGTPHDKAFGKYCHPNCNCGRFVELGNSVFMEYKKTTAGFEKLPKRNVDFGGGLERIAAAANNNPDIFMVDILRPLIDALGKSANSGYAESDEGKRKNLRVAADHIRAGVFLISDGVLPGNKERGYILRRLIRRAIFKLNRLGVKDGSWINPAVKAVASSYQSFYPEIESGQKETIGIILAEFNKFQQTIESGMKMFKKIATEARRVVSGTQAFGLLSTYGFPLELTAELAAEKNLKVDDAGFKKEFEKHQTSSRTGSAQKFKGGLADSSKETLRLHTVHHLLLRALQEVLGKSVKQRGSNITAERLRLDFSYHSKMMPAEIKKVESMVNEKIKESLPVVKTIMPKSEALKLGAESEFGQTYPDHVSVYSIGPKEATPDNPRYKETFSMEFCGGPHVKNTSELKGVFKVLKEEAVSAGVRRIKAALL